MNYKEQNYASEGWYIMQVCVSCLMVSKWMHINISLVFGCKEKLY